LAPATALITKVDTMEVTLPKKTPVRGCWVTMH